MKSSNNSREGGQMTNTNLLSILLDFMERIGQKLKRQLGQETLVK